MLNEVVSDYIKKGNTILVGAPGNGITSLTLFFANCLLKDDNIVLYYNPTEEIDRHFVKRFYPRVYRDAIFNSQPLPDLINFLSHIDYNFNYLIIDPGDSVMIDKRVIPVLVSVLKKSRGRLLVTSQIRQDPTKGGQVYSPIEKLNITYNKELFDYSIWIRNVTDTEEIFKPRYLDIFDKVRTGNKYLRRYIAKFSKKKGNVIL